VGVYWKGAEAEGFKKKKVDGPGKKKED